MDKTNEPYVVENNSMPFRVTRLLDQEGKFHQDINIVSAIQMAKNVGMDLVCFNEPEGTSPALCKIIDFGKWKYQAEKNKKKMMRKQVHTTKEVRFSPTISSHDIEHKIKQIKEFIDDGDTVIINMHVFNHRHNDNANKKIQEIIEKCTDFSKEVSRKPAERSICVTLSKK